ncbi:hypothetical protein V3N99_21750 [Dermatophilaceae bacterium Soc4.6]
MPAALAVDLCGSRDWGIVAPNTSDVSDKASVELGRALFAAMGVPHGQRRLRDDDELVTHIGTL